MNIPVDLNEQWDTITSDYFFDFGGGGDSSYWPLALIWFMEKNIQKQLMYLNKLKQVKYKPRQDQALWQSAEGSIRGPWLALSTHPYSLIMYMPDAAPNVSGMREDSERKQAMVSLKALEQLTRGVYKRVFIRNKAHYLSCFLYSSYSISPHIKLS